MLQLHCENCGAIRSTEVRSRGSCCGASRISIRRAAEQGKFSCEQMNSEGDEFLNLHNIRNVTKSIYECMKSLKSMRIL